MGVAAIGGALVRASAAKKATKGADQRGQQGHRIPEGNARPGSVAIWGVYREGGDLAQRALDFELGLGARPTFGGTAPQIETYSIPGSPQNVSVNGEATGFPPRPSPGRRLWVSGQRPDVHDDGRGASLCGRQPNRRHRIWRLHQNAGL